MKYEKLILSKKDFDMIQVILKKSHISKEITKANYDSLMTELNNVEIRLEENLPWDIVKFGSFVNVNTPFGLLEEFELVVPSKKDMANKKLSVGTPVGSAILGYAEGDEVEWNFPAGKKTIQILKVNNGPLI